MRLLFLILFLPVFCFGQYRADRARTNPSVSDGAGIGFRGHSTATTSPAPPVIVYPVYDADGNGYDTVIINTQTWLASNLRTTHYNDGVAITKVETNATWGALTTEAYCWYSNDSLTYAEDYGAIYNWYAVNTGILCPTGFHVSTREEMGTLIIYTDPTADTSSATPSSSVGYNLKEVGDVHWFGNEGLSDDAYGFAAVGAGGRSGFNGTFSNILTQNTIWCTNPYSAANAVFFRLSASSTDILTTSVAKDFGYSVRCIKD